VCALTLSTMTGGCPECECVCACVCMCVCLDFEYNDGGLS